MHARSIAKSRMRRLFIHPLINNGRVREFVAFGIHINCINPESIHASLQPEFHGRIIYSPPRLPILPIEIRLLDGKEMEIVLPRPLIPFPRTPTKEAPPVIRRHPRSILRIPCRSPDIPIPLGVIL